MKTERNLRKEKARKEKEGTVVSTKMQKTVTVRVERTFLHPDYPKVVTRGKKYYAHCDMDVKEGQQVRIEETRPISKLKRWRVIEVLA